MKETSAPVCTARLISPTALLARPGGRTRAPSRRTRLEEGSRRPRPPPPRSRAPCRRGLLELEEPAGDHQLRAAPCPRRRDQPLRAAGAGQHAQAHLGQADLARALRARCGGRRPWRPRARRPRSGRSGRRSRAWASARGGSASRWRAGRSSTWTAARPTASIRMSAPAQKNFSPAPAGRSTCTPSSMRAVEDRGVELPHHVVRVRVGGRVGERQDGDAVRDVVAHRGIGHRLLRARSYRMADGPDINAHRLVIAAAGVGPSAAPRSFLHLRKRRRPGSASISLIRLCGLLRAERARDLLKKTEVRARRRATDPRRGLMALATQNLRRARLTALPASGHQPSRVEIVENPIVAQGSDAGRRGRAHVQHALRDEDLGPRAGAVPRLPRRGGKASGSSARWRTRPAWTATAVRLRGAGGLRSSRPRRSSVNRSKKALKVRRHRLAFATRWGAGRPEAVRLRSGRHAGAGAAPRRTTQGRQGTFGSARPRPAVPEVRRSLRSRRHRVTAACGHCSSLLILSARAADEDLRRRRRSRAARRHPPDRHQLPRPGRARRRSSRAATPTARAIRRRSPSSRAGWPRSRSPCRRASASWTRIASRSRIGTSRAQLVQSIVGRAGDGAQARPPARLRRRAHGAGLRHGQGRPAGPRPPALPSARAAPDREGPARARDPFLPLGAGVAAVVPGDRQVEGPRPGAGPPGRDAPGRASRRGASSSTGRIGWRACKVDGPITWVLVDGCFEGIAGHPDEHEARAIGSRPFVIRSARRRVLPARGDRGLSLPGLRPRVRLRARGARRRVPQLPPRARSRSRRACASSRIRARGSGRRGSTATTSPSGATSSGSRSRGPRPSRASRTTRACDLPAGPWPAGFGPPRRDAPVGARPPPPGQPSSGTRRSRDLVERLSPRSHGFSRLTTTRSRWASHCRRPGRPAR